MYAEQQSMSKLIKTVEVFKSKIDKFYMRYEIKTDIVVDVYNPMEEGLDVVTIDRPLPVLKCYVSLSEMQEHKNYPGYREIKSDITKDVTKDFLDEVHGFLNKDKYL